jgi:crotonobetainyl-CoA:carnitine CoA-transferase CaiB-like acyl-CoA transferase
LLAANNQRVRAREQIMPRLRALFAGMPTAELLARCGRANLPFAPITRPEDLVDDPHLLASGGLVKVKVRDGVVADLPALPLRMGEARAGLRRDPPASGEHSREILGEALGLTPDALDALEREGAFA